MPSGVVSDAAELQSSLQLHAWFTSQSDGRPRITYAQIRTERTRMLPHWAEATTDSEYALAVAACFQSSVHEAFLTKRTYSRRTFQELTRAACFRNSEPDARLEHKTDAVPCMVTLLLVSTLVCTTPHD